MHSWDVVHTYLKHNDIMFHVGSFADDDFAALVEAEPSRCHPPEESSNCVIQGLSAMFSTLTLRGHATHIHNCGSLQW
jgi:hypothetical protein